MLMLLLQAKFLIRQPKLQQNSKIKAEQLPSASFLPNQCCRQLFSFNIDAERKVLVQHNL